MLSTPNFGVFGSQIALSAIVVHTQNVAIPPHINICRIFRSYMLWLVYRRSVCLSLAIWRYRCGVDILGVGVVVDAYAGAHLTILLEERHERENMVFQAEQESGGSRWPLVRINVGGVTEVVLLSERMLPLSVHWVGRSVVCSGQQCELCELLPLRGLFYFACMCIGRTSIVELGSQSSSHLEQHCKLLFGGLKAGHVIRLTRRGRKAPVYSEVVDFRPGVQSISQEQLSSRVAAIYHLPGINPGEAFDAYEMRLQKMMNVRNSHSAKRMLAGKPCVPDQLDV